MTSLVGSQNNQHQPAIGALRLSAKLVPALANAQADMGRRAAFGTLFFPDIANRFLYLRLGNSLRFQSGQARFVGPDGKPVPKLSPHFELLGSPGPDRWDLRPESKAQLAADAVWLINLDRKHYWNGQLTNAEGRITLPDLIPGALYRISDTSTMDNENQGVQVRKDFTVQPGETLDLGDVLIEKPQR